MELANLIILRPKIELIDMKKFLVVLCLLCGALGASAQPKFTYSDIAAGKFSQKSVRGLRSMSDGEHYPIRKANAIYRSSYSLNVILL